MTLGAERKKLLWLVLLLAVAGGSFLYNSSSGGGAPQASQSARPKTTLPGIGDEQTPVKNVSASPIDALRAAQRQKRSPGLRSGISEFRPSLKPQRPEDRPDPMTIDPTLRLDLLAKVQAVKFEKSGNRSLFEISQAPPKVEEPKKIVPTVVAKVWDHPQPPPAPTPTPAPPPPPPIPLKFYGFVNARAPGAPKRAFFLEGEEIHMAGEGEVIKKRYKIVKIGVNSVVVEDTEHKHQETLKLEEPAAS
jgi:hypothetical protein